MRVRSLYGLLAASALLMGTANAAITNKAVYRDAGKHTNWINQDGAQECADYFAGKGYTLLDASAIRAWLDARTADRTSSVLVSCQDALPDEAVYDDPAANPDAAPSASNPIRRYLNAGGRLSNLGDIPFYLHATDDARKEAGWADAGAPGIIGFNTSPDGRDANTPATLTAEGKAWGLTTETIINKRPSHVADVDVALSLNGAGNAPSWVKYFSSVPGRGAFVRIWDTVIGAEDAGELFGLTDALLAEFQKVTEYEPAGFVSGAITTGVQGTLKDSAGKAIVAQSLQITGGPAGGQVKSKILTASDKDGKFFVALAAGTYSVGKGGSVPADPTSAVITVSNKIESVELVSPAGQDLSSDAGQSWEILLPAAEGSGVANMPKDDPNTIPAKAGFTPMNVPEDWNSLDATDNIWGIYRTKVTVPDDMVGKDQLLTNFNFDDNDWTYWNGTFIGNTNVWDATRNYVVPGTLVKKTNDLVIIGFDGGGGGGISLRAPKLIPIRAGGVISGTITDQKGNPVSGVTFTAAVKGGAFGDQTTAGTSDSKGNYILGGLGAGSYSLTLTGGPGGSRLPAATSGLNVTAGGTVTQNFTNVGVPYALVPAVTMSLRAEDLKTAGLPGWRFLGQPLADAADPAAVKATADTRALIGARRAEFGAIDYVDTGKDAITGLTWLAGDWQYVPGDAGGAGRNGDPDGIPDNTDWVQRIHFKLTGELDKAGPIQVTGFNVDDDVRGAYINGVQLAKDLPGWDTPRTFVFPAEALKHGGADNVFTIVGGEGGGGAGHNIDLGGPMLVGLEPLPPIVGGVLGDLNADTKINVQDATISLRIAVGAITPTDAQKATGDVNKDGKWNVQDTTLILRRAVGAIDKFPGQ